jgi:hypothetical protein
MAKKLPKVSILDRRKANPFGAPSIPITLKTPGDWTVRIVNSTVRTGRLHDMIHNKGWVYVNAEELDGTPDELGFHAKDGRVVRGEHGEEVLMKIPTADFDAVQDAKTRANIKGLGKRQTLEDAANRVGKVLGDEAGETVARASIDINDSRVQFETEDAEA